jgi:Ca-activated chloride channel homolog
MWLTYRLPIWLVPALAVLTCALAPLAANARSAPVKPPALVVVLDASAAMLGRDALAKQIDGLPDSSEAALIAYRHRSPDKCDDVELLLPIAPLDKPAFADKVAALTPKGNKSPLTAATRRALELAKRRAGPTTVVLISAGLESCTLSPQSALCDVVKQAKAGKSDFVLHVVGFDLKGADSTALRCAAEAGGGRYFEAGNAAELGAALEQSVSALRVPTGALTVSASAGGKPIAAHAEVRRTGDKRFFGRKQVNLGGADKPVAFRLPGGAYDLRVTPQQRGLALFEAANIALVPGRQVAQAASFGPGKLSLTVTLNAAPLQQAPVIKLRRAGETKTLLVNERMLRGSASKPEQGKLELELAAGTYDVDVTSAELGAGVKRSLRVLIEAGKTASQTCDIEAGQITVGAKKDGQPLGATIVIRSGATRAASGATSVAKPEKTFLLEPGIYEVEVSVPKLRASKRFEATLRPKDDVHQTAEL